MTQSVPPIPTHIHSITPYLSVPNTDEAINFYTAAFGAEESMRLTDRSSGDVLYAYIKIGSAGIMLSDEIKGFGNPSPLTLGGTPVRINLFVADVDASFAQAIEAGATQLSPPTDQFFGDRSCRLTDPFGHIWIVSSRIELVSPEEMQRRMDALTG